MEIMEMDTKNGDSSTLSLTPTPSPIRLDCLDTQGAGDRVLYQLHTSLDYGPGIADTSEETFVDMLHDDSTLNYSRVEPQLAEFKEAIIKRDEIIKNLVNSHESLRKELEDKDEELRDKDEELRNAESMANELTTLRETLQAFVQNSEVLRDQSLPFNDVSSYLTLPEATLPNSHLPLATKNAKANSDQDLQTSESEHSSPVPNCNNSHEVEDLKLQIADIEKKLEANNKYLEEVTTEREHERDEYHREISNMEKKLADLKKENEKLEDINAHQRMELDDYEVRLKDADDVEQELVEKSAKVEEELKSAVNKIYELREIIRDLEEQIDSASGKASELKEQNQCLTDELERLENKLKEHEDLMQTTQDTLTSGVNEVMLEEIQTQISDLTSKLEKKLVDMDNFPWSTRPNSSCSGAQYLSTEDVSVKELSNFSRTIQAATPHQVADGLCRLEAHFESLIRFEEVIMKKVKDNEMRYGLARKRQEELENEKVALQETMKEQILKISDLQSRLDQCRFEPSPNTVTLTGLRSRVQQLSEQVEEYKGHLQLKCIENQDMEHKLASSQALLSKTTAQLQHVTNMNRLQATATQAQQELKINSYAQTEPVTILRHYPLGTKEASVQVQMVVGAQNSNNYLNYPLDSLELSTIQGAPPPTHSTPNDPPLDTARRKKIVSWTSELERNSPEVMRYRQNEGMMQHSPVTSTNLSTTPEKYEINERIFDNELLLVHKENQNLENKLSSAQELISKLRYQNNKTSGRVGITQTEAKLLNNVSVQTELHTPEVAFTQTEDKLLKNVSIQVELQEQIVKKDSRNVETQSEQKFVRNLSSQTELIHSPVVKNSCLAFTQTEQRVVRDMPIQTEQKPVRNMPIQTEVVTTIETYSAQTQVSLSNPPNEQTIHLNRKKSSLNKASIELYLRTKSHRKALSWQKKYLTIVIHGYKDLLCDLGVGSKHPDYFQKELSIVPTSIGLVNPRSPLTRFRIIAKVVIATSRMKYMVRRWENKIHHGSSEGASFGSKENSPPNSLKAEAMTKPVAATGINKGDYRNVLTQYLERFQNLENEIGQTILTRTNRTNHK